MCSNDYIFSLSSARLCCGSPNVFDVSFRYYFPSSVACDGVFANNNNHERAQKMRRSDTHALALTHTVTFFSVDVRRSRRYKCECISLCFIQIQCDDDVFQCYCLMHNNDVVHYCYLLRANKSTHTHTRILSFFSSCAQFFCLVVCSAMPKPYDWCCSI